MSRQEQEKLSFKDESSICESMDESEVNDAKDDFQLGVRYLHIVQVDELRIIPLRALFDTLQAEEQMETECSLIIEVFKATLLQDTKFMVSNELFVFLCHRTRKKWKMDLTDCRATQLRLWYTTSVHVFFFNRTKDCII